MKKLEKEFKEAVEHTSSSVKTANSAKANPKYSNEQRYKLQEKAEAAEINQNSVREKYKQSVTDLGERIIFILVLLI
jgi:hypothetical protein